MGKKTKAKRGAKKVEKKTNPLFQKRPRNFRPGNDIQPKRNLTRFVKWPKYIIFQRQKRILLSRIKVPPIIAQFSRALEKNQANILFKLLRKYKPQDSKKKNERLKEEAKLRAESIDFLIEEKPVNSQKPYVLKFGLNHVTKLVEQKKAKFVAIASDVDPIELVVWLPTLCRRMNVPYCFVKGTSKLGTLVGLKNASCVALTDVRKEDQTQVNNLATAFKANFNQNKEMRRQIGGFQRGSKSQVKHQRQLAEKEKQTIKKATGN